MSVIIPLTKGQETVIDNIDSDLANLKWYAVWSKRFYAVREIKVTPGKNGKSKAERLHVVIMERMLGRKIKKGEEVDHKDLNSLNNQRSNLRLATHAMNSANCRARGASGIKGAYLRENGKWRSIIRFNNKAIHLGTYDTAEEAHRAYCEKAIELFGEFARFE